MIYLDSSALLKLVVEEPESGALQRWLEQRHEQAMVSSELCTVEVLRASRRLGSQHVVAARVLLGQLDLIPLTGGVVELAAEVGSTSLRSLDALHLASALSLAQDVDVLVGYDVRLCEAATAASLTVHQPRD